MLKNDKVKIRINVRNREIVEQYFNVYYLSLEMI